MLVTARDQQSPFEQTGQATVRVNVRRNTQSPFFEGTPYNAQLSENSLVSTSVFTVVARDNDIQVHSAVSFRLLIFVLLLFLLL